MQSFLFSLFSDWLGDILNFCLYRKNISALLKGRRKKLYIYAMYPLMQFYQVDRNNRKPRRWGIFSFQFLNSPFRWGQKWLFWGSCKLWTHINCQTWRDFIHLNHLPWFQRILHFLIKWIFPAIFVNFFMSYLWTALPLARNVLGGSPLECQLSQLSTNL